MSKQIIISLFAAIALISSCSQEKNTIVNRSYHNLTARYNGFFNGRLALQDAHKQMEEAYEEDYSKLLPIFIYNNQEAVQPVYPNLERAIDKTSLVINRHSMDINGVEYCKWIDDTWLVMAEAQFLKGELLQAKQICDFVKLKYPDPETRMMSLFWLARIYTAQGEYTRAGDQLRKVTPAEGFPEKHLGEYYAFLADFYLRQDRLTDAIEALEASVEHTKKRQVKTRRMYILAQLYRMNGDGISSSKMFAEVIRRNPEYEMAFYAKISRALAYDVTAGNSDEIRAILNKMLKDAKNAEYQDEIYYALAELDLKESREPEAISNLQLATKNSVRNGNTKGLAFYKLGEIYFDKKDYPRAQAYYDSTVTFLSTEHPDYTRILARANSLTQMMRDLEVIEMQDSLQAFAKLPTAQQERMIDNMIADYKQAEIDAQRQKELQQIQSEQNQLNQNATIKGNTGKGDWYFVNPTALGFGATEFKRKWGNRKNEDDWRRADKTSLAALEVETEDSALDTLDGAKDPHHPNFYWKNVPDTEEKLAKSDALIVEALYDLGLVYKEQMQDPDMAIQTFEDLIARYDSSKYHPNTYFQLYRMYSDKGISQKADYYKDLLIREYPETDYAKVLMNPAFTSSSAEHDAEAARTYETAYAYFQQGYFNDAFQHIQVGLGSYKGSSYEPQFRLLGALCQGRFHGEPALITELEKVEREFGNHEVSQEAHRILEYLRNGRQISTTTSQSEEEAAQEALEKEMSQYEFALGDPHNFIMIVPDSVDINAVQAQVSNFNRINFASKGYKTTMMPLNDGRKMVMVNDVGYVTKAKDYIGTFQGATDLTGAYTAAGYPMFIISLENFKAFFKSQNVEAYMAFYQEKYVK